MEPDVAVNPVDQGNLLGACQFESGPHTRLPGTFASFDGGHTWIDKGVLALPRGYDQGADTTVGFDQRGDGFVVALLTTGGGGYASRVTRGGIFLWRTDDGGRSFGRPVPVYVGAGFQDHLWFAVRQMGARAVVLVAWTNTAGLEFAESANGGATFTPPRVVVAGAAPQDPVLTLGGADVVRIFFEEFLGASIGLEVVTSADGGRHFQPATTIGTVSSPPLSGAGPKGGAQPPPLLTATNDPAGTRSAVAISGQDATSGHPVIELWLADPASDGWQGPTQPIGGVDANRSQTQPRLLLANHRLYLSYFTSTRDGHFSERLARGSVGGQLISMPLSTEPFTATGFLGDYQGLAIAGAAAYAVWNDARPENLLIIADRFPL